MKILRCSAAASDAGASTSRAISIASLTSCGRLGEVVVDPVHLRRLGAEQGRAPRGPLRADPLQRLVEQGEQLLVEAAGVAHHRDPDRGPDQAVGVVEAPGRLGGPLEGLAARPPRGRTSPPRRRARGAGCSAAPRRARPSARAPRARARRRRRRPRRRAAPCPARRPAARSRSPWPDHRAEPPPGSGARSSPSRSSTLPPQISSIARPARSCRARALRRAELLVERVAHEGVGEGVVPVAEVGDQPLGDRLLAPPSSAARAAAARPARPAPRRSRGRSPPRPAAPRWSPR